MPIWLKDWWPLIVLLLPLTIGGVGWVIRMGLASRRDMEAGLAGVSASVAAEATARSEALAKLDEKVSLGLVALDRRTLRIESDIQHLPTADDIAEMKSQLSRLDEQSRATTRELVSISNALGKIMDQMFKGPIR